MQPFPHPDYAGWLQRYSYLCLKLLRLTDERNFDDNTISSPCEPAVEGGGGGGGERKLTCLLSLTCNYVSVQRGFLFLVVLWMGCVI